MDSTVVRKPRREVETGPYLRMVARVLSAAGSRVADADPADLTALLELRELVDAAILEAVRGLRRNGSTWEEIGAAAGITRQGAIRHWNSRL